MKNQLLCALLLAALAATSLAAPPTPLKMNDRSTAISQFAASHQRIKALLFPQDREILDQLSAKVKKALRRNAQLPADVIKILSASSRGLSQQEIEALGTYVSGEISSERSNDSSLMQATQQMQETQMSFNLQYLQVQSEMQNQNRNFTTVSNIMKTKHDTVKNTISNIH